MPSHILIVEDDCIQAEHLKYRLTTLGLECHLISTESEFCKQIRRDDFPSYSLAVVDMMLPWTDPSPIMEQPPLEIMQEGSYMAGLRCCRKLIARGVKCIIFTALSPKAILLEPSDEFEILHKGGDGYAHLSRAVRPFV